MRTWAAVVVTVAVLAVPSLGVINFTVTVDGQNDPVTGEVLLGVGQNTTVRVWAQTTSSALFTLGGNVFVTGTGSQNLNSVAGSSTWASTFRPSYAIHPVYGVPGDNGGWSSFGSIQTNFLYPDMSFALGVWTDLFDYTVTGVGEGSVTLTFQDATVSGFKPSQYDKITTIETNNPVTIKVTPEPVTISLLSMSGLLLARRRRA